MTTEQLQCLLVYLGYDTGGVDDNYGAKTTKAVMLFQEEYGGLDVDGNAGALTRAALIQAVGDGWARPKKPPDTVPNSGTGDEWDEIEYFTREELRCKCGGKYCNGFPAEPDMRMVRLADAARKHFGKPAHVISGLRDKQWNAIQGGVENSQHMYGEACDLRIDGVSASELCNWFSNQSGVRYTYEINSTNVHFDVPKGAR